MSPSLLYKTGDATLPPDNSPTLIVHVCNDLGAWGRGFVVALSKRYPEAKKQYQAWHQSGGDVPFALGQVQFVEVKPSLWIANLIGQHGIRKQGGVPPIRYEALREGLAKVAQFAEAHHAAVQMPRIGCGLAGGTWEEVEPLILRELWDRNLSVTVYDLPSD